MKAGRRLGRIGCVTAALVVGALGAQNVAASTYGGAAKTGPWTGSDKQGDKVSFRINHRGFGLVHLKINAAFTCESIPSDGGPNIPAPGGRLKASRVAVVPLDDFGEAQAIVKTTVPGVSNPVRVQFQMGFTSHHQIPPPARNGTGELSGGFARDTGDQCEVGGHGADLKAHPG